MQRFITTIKIVTEKKKRKKEKLKSFIKFHSPNKIDNCNGGGVKEKKKEKKNPKESTEQVKT